MALTLLKALHIVLEKVKGNDELFVTQVKKMAEDAGFDWNTRAPVSKEDAVKCLTIYWRALRSKFELFHRGYNFEYQKDMFLTFLERVCKDLEKMRPLCIGNDSLALDIILDNFKDTEKMLSDERSRVYVPVKSAMEYLLESLDPSETRYLTPVGRNMLIPLLEERARLLQEEYHPKEELEREAFFMVFENTDYKRELWTMILHCDVDFPAERKVREIIDSIGLSLDVMTIVSADIEEVERFDKTKRDECIYWIEYIIENTTSHRIYLKHDDKNSMDIFLKYGERVIERLNGKKLSRDSKTSQVRKLNTFKSGLLEIKKNLMKCIPNPALASPTYN